MEVGTSRRFYVTPRFFVPGHSPMCEFPCVNLCIVYFSTSEEIIFISSEFYQISSNDVPGTDLNQGYLER